MFFFLFCFPCRTSAAGRVATRWALLMLGRCVIPREAAQSSRTTACRLPSRLHMSLVRSFGWSGVCACVGVKKWHFLNLHMSHFCFHIVPSCRPRVEYASRWVKDMWAAVWRFGRKSPDGSAVRQTQQNCAVVALQRPLHHRVLRQRARWGLTQRYTWQSCENEVFFVQKTQFSSCKMKNLSFFFWKEKLLW